jgi:hypothetical protein
MIPPSDLQPLLSAFGVPSWMAWTLQALPFALWVYVGLGVPFALWLLPRADWRKPAVVGALGITMGASLLTAWLFILGTLGDLRMPPIVAGLVGLNALGVALARRKARTTTAPAPLPHGWQTGDYALMGLIALSVLAVWVTTSFWVFSAYDTLWVYGYEGRLYALTGGIPASIGYYPQYVPLQYAFFQVVLGVVNDHVARVAVPFMHLASVLSVYSLGAMLFRPRVGLWAAGLWALYPHVGYWAQMGDLEIPLASHFALSGAFFLTAWHEADPALRRRYALISGLVLGALMWTKPTGGAFILGVVLCVGLAFVVGGRAWARFEVAFWAGIACLPLGAVWYVRNALLGHDVIDFPHPSWLTLATRSGDLWGWGLLAVACALAWGLRAGLRSHERALALTGAGLVLMGVVPSMPFFAPERLNAPESYMRAGEVGLFVLGVVVLCAVGWRWLARADAPTRTDARKIAWALALALPYFAVWFYAYSYHFRLSFAIVPLLILPTARLITPLWEGWQARPRRRWHAALMGVGVGLACLALVPAPLVSATPEGDLRWLTGDLYPDDRAKYIKTNGTLMLLVDELTAYAHNTGVTPVLVAPGEQQLPFFFPLWDIGTETLPRTLDDIAHATHYLYGTLAEYRYADANIPAHENALVSALGRTDTMKRTVYHDEGIFRVELYEQFHTRFDAPQIGYVYPHPIQVGDFAEMVADEVGNTYLNGQRFPLTLVWRVKKPAEHDYTLLIRMIDNADERVFYTWEERFAPSAHGDYSTRFWQAGETFIDRRRLLIDNDKIAYKPADGAVFRVELSLFRSGDPDRTPLTLIINGEARTSWRLFPPFYFS